MDSLQQIVEQQGFVVLDGALATELEQRGADLDDPLWSARLLHTAPDLIRRVHYSYFEAGADIAITASYQASFEGFARRGISGEGTVRLLHRSVELAAEARDQFWRQSAGSASRQRPLVAASVGPYGAFLADGSEYRGNYGLSVEQLIDWHRPRLEALLQAGPDLLAIETIPCLEEAKALLILLKAFPHARAWISFSCCDEAHICQGQSFVDAVALVNTSQQIEAVGINCSPPQYISPLLDSAWNNTSKYLLAYPNSGEAWDAGRHCWTSAGQPFAFGEAAVQWYRAGARLLGGCCRTRPDDIRRMRKALLEHRESLLS